MSFKHIQINDVIHIVLEPTWDGKRLTHLSMILTDAMGDSFEVLAVPVDGGTVDLLFPDPPDSLDNLDDRGFADITDQERH